MHEAMARTATGFGETPHAMSSLILVDPMNTDDQASYCLMGSKYIWSI